MSKNNPKSGLGRRLLEYISTIEDQTQKLDAEETAYKLIATKDTTTIGAIEQVIALSISKNPFEAVKEWELINHVEVPRWERKDLPKDWILGECFHCGRNVKAELYELINTKDTNRLITVGYTCHKKAELAFQAFGQSIAPTKKLIKDKQEKKQAGLEQVAKDPNCFEKILQSLKDKKDDLSDAFKDLYQDFKDNLKYTALTLEATPELFDSDFEDHFISANKQRNFLNWFAQQKQDGKLKGVIADIYSRSRKDLVDINPAEWAALYMYAANNRKMSKRVLIGSVAADLKLLSQLPKDHELIQKYGPVDIHMVKDILEQKERPITLLEASRVFDAKPEILEIRKEVNAKTKKEKYDGETLDVIMPLEKIFMTEKGHWREEYLTGQNLYDKTLNASDYKFVKSLLKKGTIGKGTFEENLFSGHSMENFEDVVDHLEIIRRKMRYQTNVLKERGIELEDEYDLTHELQETLDKEDFLKGKNYRLEESFKENQNNTSGMELKDLIERIEKTAVEEKGFKTFERMRKRWLPKIKAQQEAGLYHENDVERLLGMYDRISESTDKINSEIEDTISKFTRFKELDILNEYIVVPDISKKYFTANQLATLKKLTKSINELDEIIENKDEFAGKIGKLKELDSNYWFLNLFPGSDRDEFFLFPQRVTFDFDRARSKCGCFAYYHPESLERTFRSFTERYSTLSDVLEEDPELLTKAKEISDNVGLFQRYGKTRSMAGPRSIVTHRSVGSLQLLIKSDPEKTKISKNVKERIDFVYEKLRDYKTRAQEEKNYVVNDETIKAAIKSGFQSNYNPQDESATYKVFIPKGRGKTSTYDHKEFIKSQGFRWRNNGWNAELVQKDLGRFADKLAQYNAENKINLKLELELVED